jgi:hypothetical protein
VQLLQDATQDLAVVAPWLATPAVGGQERFDTPERLIGELQHRRLLTGGYRNATLSANTTNKSKVRL